RGDGLVGVLLFLQRIELARHVVEGLGRRCRVPALQRGRRLTQGIPHLAVLRLLRRLRQRLGQLLAVFGCKALELGGEVAYRLGTLCRVSADRLGRAAPRRGATERIREVLSAALQRGRSRVGQFL